MVFIISDYAKSLINLKLFTSLIQGNGDIVQETAEKTPKQEMYFLLRL